MAALVCNIAKGREVEFYNRILVNDPTNSAFIMLILALGGDDLDTLQDYDTVSALLAGPSNEVTNTGYSRKTITALSAWAPDDSTDSVLLTLPIQTWSSPAAGDTWDKGVVAYDPDTTSGTDTTLIPVTVFDVRYLGSPIVPDGNPIDVDLSAGFVSAV